MHAVENYIAMEIDDNTNKAILWLVHNIAAILLVLVLKFMIK